MGIMGQATGPQKDRLQPVHNRSFWFPANWATGNWTDHNWSQLATAVQVWSVVVQSSCQSLYQLPTGLRNTNCHREAFHEQWKVLLDEEFLHAYEHRIVIKCSNGITQRFYPRIFTYSADYPCYGQLLGLSYFLDMCALLSILSSRSHLVHRGPIYLHVRSLFLFSCARS